MKIKNISVTPHGVQIITSLVHDGPENIVTIRNDHSHWNDYVASAKSYFEDVKEIEGKTLVQIDVARTETQWSFQ